MQEAHDAGGPPGKRPIMRGTRYAKINTGGKRQISVPSSY